MSNLKKLQDLRADVVRAEDRLDEAVGRAKDLGGPGDTTVEVEMVRADVRRALLALRKHERLDDHLMAA